MLEMSMLTCPAKHLVHDRLDEEDEEEPDAEQQLGERIFQLQQCRRHHPHVGGTFQGLPHLFSKIFSSSSNKSSTSPSMWMNTVEMRTPPPKHKTMPEKMKSCKCAVSSNSQKLGNWTLGNFKRAWLHSALCCFQRFTPVH